MDRRKILLTLLLGSIGAPAATADDGEGWLTLFNGRDLTGWRANVQPGSFTVVDGAIRAQSTKDRSHLFYVGDRADGFVRFRNFELKLLARGEREANSGVFFHTDFSVRDAQHHLAKGYEVQLNNHPRGKSKTGSLYTVVDLAESPVDETQWFEVYIRVEGQRIVVRLNGQTTVDYTEPPNPERPPERKGRLLDPQGGAIALQAHDPDSVYYFKDIRLRPLP